MRLQAGIALLSACSTASGTVVRGQGVVGLASALRVAGVRSVILTRWPSTTAPRPASSMPSIGACPRGCPWRMRSTR